VNQHQILTVQRTFALAQPDADALARRFYARLFALEPGLRAMFPAELAQQRQKLMATIGVAVAGLRRPEALLPALRQLGERHAGYGVRDEHYALVGQALLGALAEHFGTAYTAEVAEAWAAAYGLLAGVMREAGALAAA